MNMWKCIKIAPAFAAMLLCYDACAQILLNTPRVVEQTHSLFDEMLIRIYQSHPRLNAERTNVKISDEKVSQANAGYRPTATVDGSIGRQREKVAGQSWNYGEDTAVSLNAVQPLFNGFGTLEQKRAAETRVLAARARLLVIEQNILFTAVSDWLDLCEKERILALNISNIERMKHYANATDARFKAGDGTQTDVSQSESRMAQSEARYAVAFADRNSASAAFERDTGFVAPPVEFPNMPKGLPISLEETEERARGNPQLIQARQEETAALHDIEVSESSLWPNVYLRGSISQEHSPALGLNRLRNDSITLNVTIPLYQGGGEYSRIREAKLAHERSRYDEIDIGRDVLQRARVSWYNYASASSVIVASQHASDASKRALDGVQEEQKQGLRTLTEVLDEQAEWLSAQITEAQAQKTLRVEAYRLLAATGKLTGEYLHLADRSYDPLPHHDDVVPRWAGTDIAQWEK